MTQGTSHGMIRGRGFQAEGMPGAKTTEAGSSLVPLEDSRGGRPRAGGGRCRPRAGGRPRAQANSLETSAWKHGPVSQGKPSKSRFYSDVVGSGPQLLEVLSGWAFLSQPSQLFCRAWDLNPLWGLNSRPQGRESHAPPTKPARSVSPSHLNSLRQHSLVGGAQVSESVKGKVTVWMLVRET